MKHMRTLVFAAAVALTAFLAGTTQAALIASYDYTDLAGKDPTTQGWTYDKNISNDYLGGIDASTGWRIGDGTSSGYANYAGTTGDMDVIDAAGGWEVYWTASMDSQAYKTGTDGSVGVANYFLPPNQSRQNNGGIWVENAGSYSFWLVPTADSDGNLLINDGTTNHQITTGGSNGGYDIFKDFVLTYDGSSSTATLNVDGSDYSISKRVAVGGDRVLFGAHTGSGQSSVLYSEVVMESIPEPTALGLVGLLGVVYLFHRRLLKK